MRDLFTKFVNIYLLLLYACKCRFFALCWRFVVVCDRL